MATRFRRIGNSFLGRLSNNFESRTWDYAEQPVSLAMASAYTLGL